MGALVDVPPVVTATDDYPELCVEVLWNQGPFAADGEWCDITGYVSGGQIQVGRQYELERFQSGVLNLTLLSPTRLFDPEWSSGPFQPWLVPMRQVRVSAVWNGVRYPVYRGYITDWGATTVGADNQFVTDIAARDALALLELVQLPSSAWALEQLRESPDLWFRLGETNVTRVTDSSTGGNYGIYDNVTQGVAGLIPTDADGACEWPDDDLAQDMRVTIQNPSLIDSYPFSISAVVRVSGDYQYAPTVVSAFQIAGSTLTGVTVSITNATSTQAAGRVLFGVYNGATYRQVESNQIISDNKPHHIVVVALDASNFYIYIDGNDATDYTDPGSGAPTWPGTFPSGYNIGNLPNDYDSATMNYAMRGVIDEVSFFNRALSADGIARLALSATTGWSGDDSGARVERFLDGIGWPDTLRNISTGTSTLGPASWSAGTTALATIQAWADTEYGMFFADPAGRLTWHSRHRPLLDAEAATSQATFGDAHSGEALVYTALNMMRDETRIRNPVTASRDGGVSLTVRDADYEQKYGTRTWASPATQDQKDSAVWDRAVWLLERYKELGSRVASFTVSPRANTSLWAQALGRAIGDRITVKRTPLGDGNEISLDQIVEGISHQFSPMRWETTFYCSPIDPNVGEYLILDDATYGLLDTGKLAY